MIQVYCLNKSTVEYTDHQFHSTIYSRIQTIIESVNNEEHTKKEVLILISFLDKHIFATKEWEKDDEKEFR